MEMETEMQWMRGDMRIVFGTKIPFLCAIYRETMNRGGKNLVCT
jgi:hypothetical protein